MNKKKPKIAAVVVTFNRKTLLEENINALLNQTHKLDAIYIIDNASTDGTKEYLKEKNLFDKVRYFKLKENTGGAGGFNFGFEKTYRHFDWIWAMDDDAIPYKDALEKLIDNKYFNNNKIGALCCNTIYTKDSFNAVIEAIMRNDYLFYKEILNNNDFKEDFVKIRTFSLLGILIKTKIIKEIGNVNKHLFIEGDDLDFTLRISKKYEIFWIRHSKLLHKVSKNMFNTKKILNRNINIISSNQIWKEYYGIRNHIYILKNSKLISKKEILNYVVYNIKYYILIIFFLDKKILRLVVLSNALKDGFRENLGKKYDYRSFD